MIKSVAHVALYCRDVDRSADFYTRVLGMKKLFTQNKPDGSLWYIYLHAGSGTFLELFPFESAQASSGEGAPGVAHICLAVDDIEESVSRINDADWPLESAPKLGLDGNRQAWLVDPDGVRIELMQMMPDCLQYKAMKELGLS
ncbi:MAG: VOC family protein [Planctomycetota bacterium]|jgi:lactoylglutathione lyase